MNPAEFVPGTRVQLVADPRWVHVLTARVLNGWRLDSGELVMSDSSYRRGEWTVVEEAA